MQCDTYIPKESASSVVPISQLGIPIQILSEIKMKYCNKCGILKELSCFTKDKSKKDGLRTDCKVCRKFYEDNWKYENKEKVSEYMENWYKENKDSVLEYRKQNKDRTAEYYRNNRSRYNAHAAKRRASKLNSTPSWLTDRELELINQMYLDAKYLESKNGIKYHVDHIVPLQGENVCGLHVPWNLQVITAEENLIKSNNYED